MERELLAGREALLICSASSSGGVGGSATHRSMVELYESYDCVCDSSVVTGRGLDPQDLTQHGLAE